MIVRSLELKDFRNYQNLKIEFADKTNILFGDNAQGKTNILEALCVSATSRSHRGSRDREMIRFSQDQAHIRTVVERSGLEHQIDIHLKKNHAKGIAIDKNPVRRAADLFGILSVVFFSPEDLNIIKNGPAERRRFMDMELCQLDRIYLSDLTAYHKVLTQRNRLLKEMDFHSGWKDTLDIWDMQLIRYGSRLIKRRDAFVKDLNHVTGQIHESLTGGREHLHLTYEPDTAARDYEAVLKSRRQQEMRMRTTSAGPHRDDIRFQINDIDIRKYGSQGQQRSAALSLKLAEIELVRRVIGDTPVLLLDDVLSELDSSRQNYLLNSIHDIQTVITCTGLDEFVRNRFHIDKVFTVNNGTVTQTGGNR